MTIITCMNYGVFIGSDTFDLNLPFFLAWSKKGVDRPSDDIHNTTHYQSRGVYGLYGTG